MNRRGVGATKQDWECANEKETRNRTCYGTNATLTRIKCKQADNLRTRLYNIEAKSCRTNYDETDRTATTNKEAKPNEWQWLRHKKNTKDEREIKDDKHRQRIMSVWHNKESCKRDWSWVKTSRGREADVQWRHIMEPCNRDTKKQLQYIINHVETLEHEKTQTQSIHYTTFKWTNTTHKQNCDKPNRENCVGRATTQTENALNAKANENNLLRCKTNLLQAKSTKRPYTCAKQQHKADNSINEWANERQLVAAQTELAAANRQHEKWNEQIHNRHNTTIPAKRKKEWQDNMQMLALNRTTHHIIKERSKGNAQVATQKRQLHVNTTTKRPRTEKWTNTTQKETQRSRPRTQTRHNERVRTDT